MPNATVINSAGHFCLIDVDRALECYSALSAIKQPRLVLAATIASLKSFSQIFRDNGQHLAADEADALLRALHGIGSESNAQASP